MQITNGVTFEHWPISSHVHLSAPVILFPSTTEERWQAKVVGLKAVHSGRQALTLNSVPSEVASRNILFIIKAIRMLQSTVPSDWDWLLALVFRSWKKEKKNAHFCEAIIMLCWRYFSFNDHKTFRLDSGYRWVAQPSLIPCHSPCISLDLRAQFLFFNGLPMGSEKKHLTLALICCL